MGRPTARRQEYLNAICTSDLPPSCRHVAHALARYSTGDGMPLPSPVSVQGLANATGMSKRHVQRALQTLKETGWVLPLVQMGRFHTMGYRLQIPVDNSGQGTQGGRTHVTPT